MDVETDARNTAQMFLKLSSHAVSPLKSASKVAPRKVPGKRLGDAWEGAGCVNWDRGSGGRVPVLSGMRTRY